ncbi:hypothetical protein LINPERPRIM_LOCUS22186 [Linum perenne]
MKDNDVLVQYKLLRILTNGDASFKVVTVEDGEEEERLAAAKVATAAATESEKGKKQEHDKDDESPPPSPSLANSTQPLPPTET